MTRRLASLTVTVAVVAVVLTPVAYAADGRVVDPSGRPIAGAVVTVVGIPGSATTGVDGRFRWLPEPLPPFDVLVTVSGRYSRPIRIQQIHELALIRLEPLQVEEVTVAAAASSSDVPPAGGSRTIAGGDWLAFQPTTMLQALDHVAGVSTVSEGRAAAPAIRGLAHGRTLLLIDGARVTSERRVGTGMHAVDPFSLERLDVARGPGAVAYGSDAIGGVIGVQTRRARPGSPLQARLMTTGGIGVPQAHVAMELSKGTAHGGLLVQTRYRQANDYRQPDGRRQFNSGGTDFGLVARADGQVNDGALSIILRSDRARDVGRPRSDSRLVRFAYPLEDAHRLTLTYDHPRAGALGRLAVVGFVGHHRLVTEQDRAETGISPRRLTTSIVSASDVELRATGERGLRDRGRLQFGLDATRRFGLDAVEQNSIYPPAGVSIVREQALAGANRTGIGVFGQAHWALTTRLVAAGGLRADHVMTNSGSGYFGSLKVATGAASGFGALTLSGPRGLSVTGQLSRGFRDPLLSDRYYRGPTGRGYVTGNPQLGPETSLQLDLAVRLTARSHRIAAFWYDYRIGNLVERIPVNGDSYEFRNGLAARVRGVEIEAQGNLGRGVTLGVDGHVGHGGDTATRLGLDGVGPARVTISVRRQVGRVFAEGRVSRHGAYTRPGPTEVGVPGYTFLELAAGIPVSEAVDLAVQAGNLANRLFPLSADPRGVPAPGR